MSIKSATSSIALIALLAAGPTAVFAQTTTTTPPADGTTVAPDATTGDVAPAAEPEVPAQPVEGQITMQSDGTALASDLLGSSVYSSTDETIGEISDMIVNLDGTIEGVVIGVGGFLGLGEKSVAIEMGSLSVTTNEDGEARLQSTATREDLEAAPEFMTMEDQEAAEQASQPADTTMPADGTTAPAGGTMVPADGTTAPADAAAPPVEGTTPPVEGETETVPGN